MFCPPTMCAMSWEGLMETIISVKLERCFIVSFSCRKRRDSNISVVRSHQHTKISPFPAGSPPCSLDSAQIPLSGPPEWPTLGPVRCGGGNIQMMTSSTLSHLLIFTINSHSIINSHQHTHACMHARTHAHTHMLYL